jgi:hypothetical protein
VSTVDQWKEFSRNWDDVNSEEEFGVFHMTDFNAKQEQFALWDDVKRQRVMRKLINLINTRTLHGFVAGVTKSAYDEFVPQEMRKLVGHNHYTFAAITCTAKIREWRNKYYKSSPMQYVFEK